MNWTERTELLIGKENLQKLQNSHVLIVGLGGVGGVAAEQLCRAGIGEMTIIDSKKVEPPNRNRQISALKSTENLLKVNVIAERMKDINPEIRINIIDNFIVKDEISEILTSEIDYVIDAIDTLLPKKHLIYNCVHKNINIISSLGSGGKLDPSQIKIADISETYNCHLARMLRKKLHRLNIYKGVKVVFSTEKAAKTAEKKVTEEYKKTTLGTISYIPAIFGNFCASVVIRDLIK